jgi:pSer/pThr/pTyr-binding forkhead associated (FHA) protein
LSRCGKKFHGKTGSVAIQPALQTRFKAMPRVTITAPDTNPQPYRFQLDRRVVTLGRGSDNDIVIDCGSVSGSHAEMRRREGGYELRDMESTNGIKLDGERMSVIPLRSGLSVKLGDVAFDFQLSDEECEALEREKPAEESPILREPEEAPHQKVSSANSQSEEANPKRWPIIWFVILAAMAFFVGMAVRYEKETGGSWIQAVKARVLGNPAAEKGGK